MYKEINRLWVSCVSRWGCLNDSDFNVVANLECICTNKKRYMTEGEKRKKAPRRWAQLPWSYTSFVSDLCSHARRCVWLPPPPLLFETASAQIHKTLVILRGGLHRVHCVISVDDYSSGNKHQEQRWNLNIVTCAVNLKNTLSCYISLPDTAFNTSYSRKHWLQDSDYFDERGRPKSTRQGRGICICRSAATGIFNM